MRLSLSLLTALGLAPVLASQSDNNFPGYAEATTFTSRSGLAGGSDGEILMRVSHNANDPIGTGLGPMQAEYCGELQTLNAATGLIVSLVNGWQIYIQDQSGVTPEFYDVVIIPDDTTGQPDVTTDLARVGPIQMPTSTATGAVAWVITGGFGTLPVVYPVGSDNIYYGCRIDPNTLWTADGASLHGAWTTAGTSGDNVNTIAPQLCYTIDRTGGNTIANPGDHRMHRMFLRGPGSVHINGADIDPAFQRGPNPAFGEVGNYPDQTARADGLAFSYRDANYPATPVATLGAFGGFGTPVPVAGAVQGFICLNFATLSTVTFSSGTTDANGVFDSISLQFPFLGGGGATSGNWNFQSFALDIAQLAFITTNGSMMYPN